MDRSTFIVEFAKALAWPAVAVTALVMFGGELLRLLQQITEIKIGNVEIKRQIQAASVELSKAEATSEPIPPSPVSAGDDVLTATAVIGPVIKPIDRKLAIAEPVAATLLAWMNIEKAIRHVVSVSDVSSTLASSNLSTMVMGMHYDGFFDANAWNAIKSLQTVRNKLAHGEGSIDSDAAAQYVENAERLVNLLLNSRPKQHVVS